MPGGIQTSNSIITASELKPASYIARLSKTANYISSQVKALTLDLYICHCHQHQHSTDHHLQLFEFMVTDTLCVTALSLAQGQTTRVLHQKSSYKTPM